MYGQRVPIQRHLDREQSFPAWRRWPLYYMEGLRVSCQAWTSRGPLRSGVWPSTAANCVAQGAGNLLRPGKGLERSIWLRTMVSLPVIHSPWNEGSPGEPWNEGLSHYSCTACPAPVPSCVEDTMPFTLLFLPAMWILGAPSLPPKQVFYYEFRGQQSWGKRRPFGPNWQRPRRAACKLHPPTPSQDAKFLCS